MSHNQILIIGASGFIGSNLVSHLITQKKLNIYGVGRQQGRRDSHNYKYFSLDDNQSHVVTKLITRTEAAYAFINLSQDILR